MASTRQPVKTKFGLRAEGGQHKKCQYEAREACDWAFTCKNTSILLILLVNSDDGESLVLSQESRQADSFSFHHPCTRAVAVKVLRVLQVEISTCLIRPDCRPRLRSPTRNPYTMASYMQQYCFFEGVVTDPLRLIMPLYPDLQTPLRHAMDRCITH